MAEMAHRAVRSSPAADAPAAAKRSDRLATRDALMIWIAGSLAGWAAVYLLVTVILGR